MASGAIHCTGTETPIARVTHAGRYRYITVTIDDAVTLFLPDGPNGPKLARALAEALLTAATAQEIAQIEGVA